MTFTFRNIARFFVMSLFVCCFWQAEGQNAQSLQRNFRDNFNQKNTFSFYAPFEEGVMVPDSVIISTFYPGKENLPDKNWFARKLCYEHLLYVNQKDVRFSIDPVVYLELGKQEQGFEKVYRNSRGFMVNGMLGGRINFYSFFLENQSRFMDHVDQFAHYYGVVPGQGARKAFNITDHDYAWSEGGFQFKVNDNFKVKLFSGKTHIGSGYRSLLLSDAAFSYPQIVFDIHNKKIRYLTWFASFMNPDYRGANIDGNIQWQKKIATFHYLIYKPVQALELGFFESNVWHNRDEFGKNHFRFEHVNPIILTNLLNHDNNSVLGLNINASLKSIHLYGQLVSNKNFVQYPGFQFGARYMFAGRSFTVSVFSEYNQVPPNVYSHLDSVISYTHYNQSLAHPLGENFTEWVSGVKSRYKRLELEYKVNTSKCIINDSKFTRYNTHIPDYYLHSINTNLLDGEKVGLLHHDLRISYIINPLTNLRLAFGGVYRQENRATNEYQNRYFYVGLMSDLFNRYYDF